jgi:hypothetical protein
MSIRHAPRRGAVMFVALAALATVAAIAAAMLQGAITGRRHLRTERDSLQVEQLLALAARDAEARCAARQPLDEVRLVPAEAIVGVGAARITAAAAAAPGGDRVVRLVVEYPLEGPVTIRRSREIVVPSREPSPVPSPSPQDPSP